jgi:hypothetical protein
MENLMEEEPLFRTNTGNEDMKWKAFRIGLAKKQVSKLASQRVTPWAAEVSHPIPQRARKWMGHGVSGPAISPATANP